MFSACLLFVFALEWLPGADERQTAKQAQNFVQVSVPVPAPGLKSGELVTHQDGGIILRRLAVVREGQLLVAEVRGTDDCGGAVPKVGWQSGSFNTHAVRDGWYHALLPVSLTIKLATHRLTVECGSHKGNFDVPVVAGIFPESRLSVDPKFTAPPPRRTVLERQMITAAMSRSEPQRQWRAGFVRPTVAVETSPFGVRRTFNGQTKSRHMGEDFDGKIGEAMWAANDGIVVLAAQDFFFVGNAVFIDHGEHLYTMYFHMTQMQVKTGDTVVRGQIIGNVGSTGRATGPHIHFGVKLAGTYIDPADLFAYNPKVLLGDPVQLLATDR